MMELRLNQPQRRRNLGLATIALFIGLALTWIACDSGETSEAREGVAPDGSTPLADGAARAGETPSPAESGRGMDSSQAGVVSRRDVVMVDGEYPAAVVSGGRPIPEILKRIPKEDPELYTIEQGRRDVDPIDTPFEGGASSATELALMILDALEYKDTETLGRLRVTYPEFRDILWPEFPESRPATGISADDAWILMRTDIASGALYGINHYGGMPLEFEALSFETGLIRFTNFNLYKGVRIHVRRPDGGPEILRFVNTIVERDGKWKVYGYRDQ
jgi:hypothetical protein